MGQKIRPTEATNPVMTAPPEAQALAPTGATALTRRQPRGTGRGAENIERGDIVLPRIGICQSLSPQRDETDPKHIPGIKEGHLFNNLTGEIYEPQPIIFIPVLFQKRGVEFNPREEGGGIKDLNVPLDDPRLRFGPNGEKPVATLFHEWVVYIPASGEVVVLSFKATQLKVARQLNALVKLGGGDPFDRQYELRTAREQNQHGKFYNFSVRPAGVAADADYAYCEGLYESLRGKTIVTEVEEAEGEVPADDNLPY